MDAASPRPVAPTWCYTPSEASGQAPARAGALLYGARPPHLCVGQLRGEHGRVLRARAELRARSVRQVLDLVRGPSNLSVNQAVAEVAARNTLLRLSMPELGYLLRALPSSQVTFRRQLARFQAFGIDGLLDQKLGKCGRKRGRIGSTEVTE